MNTKCQRHDDEEKQNKKTAVFFIIFCSLTMSSPLSLRADAVYYYHKCTWEMYTYKYECVVTYARQAHAYLYIGRSRCFSRVCMPQYVTTMCVSGWLEFVCGNDDDRHQPPGWMNERNAWDNHNKIAWPKHAHTHTHTIKRNTFVFPLKIAVCADRHFIQLHRSYCIVMNGFVYREVLHHEMCHNDANRDCTQFQ